MQLSLPSQIGEMVRNEGSLGLSLGSVGDRCLRLSDVLAGSSRTAVLSNGLDMRYLGQRSKGACLLNPQDKSSWLAKCHPVRMGTHDTIGPVNLTWSPAEMK